MKLLRKVKLKKTLATTRETSSEIYIPQYFKPKKKICHIIPIFFFFFFFFDNWIVSSRCLRLFSYVVKSNVAKFTARKELE